jgi:hypothetical protein
VVPGFVFQNETRIAASIGGTVKATDFFIVKSTNIGPTSNQLLPLLVVSIRGTASRVDRMVNLNGESRPMDIQVRTWSTDRIYLTDFLPDQRSTNLCPRWVSEWRGKFDVTSVKENF